MWDKRIRGLQPATRSPLQHGLTGNARLDQQQVTGSLAILCCCKPMGSPSSNVLMHGHKLQFLSGTGVLTGTCNQAAAGVSCAWMLSCLPTHIISCHLGT